MFWCLPIYAEVSQIDRETSYADQDGYSEENDCARSIDKEVRQLDRPSLAIKVRLYSVLLVSWSLRKPFQSCIINLNFLIDQLQLLLYLSISLLVNNIRWVWLLILFKREAVLWSFQTLFATAKVVCLGSRYLLHFYWRPKRTSQLTWFSLIQLNLYGTTLFSLELLQCIEFLDSVAGVIFLLLLLKLRFINQLSLCHWFFKLIFDFTSG